MLPENVNSSMQSFCGFLDSRLPESIDAVYLYGSLALNAYIEGSSDIDFIVLVNRALTATDKIAIFEAHKDLEKIVPEIDIMGSYIRLDDLGKWPNENPDIIAYYNKQIHTDGKGTDLNPVTWWILRQRGICIYGQNVEFTFEIKEESLVQYVKENMNTYWVSWINRLSEQAIAPGLSEKNIKSQLDEAVEWCVLGMLRQMYTIREHDVTSKINAGNYGLKILPKRWHGLIREAISIKCKNPVVEYESQEVRLNDLLELLKMIHAECNG